MLIEESRENHQTVQVRPKSNPLQLYSGSDKQIQEISLIDRVPEELWNEVRDIVQETGIKTIPMEKKSKKAKWLSEEALQRAVKRKEVKTKEKRKDISI